MSDPVTIENVPEEMGEEISVDNNDEGTLPSKTEESPEDDPTPLTEEAAPPTEEAEEQIVEATEDAVDTNEEVEEEKKEEESEVETEEREFDKNPTVLYALVQKKLWKESIARAKSNPKEARAYITRKEKDGRIRWRLLPLHAAIVFKAPEGVIEALLTAFPKGAEAKDDQEMLPLHLAFRNNASEAVVNLLLLAYPESVDSPDRKGRVPLTLAKAAVSPNRELYIEALEKGPSHYVVTALALTRERIIVEQKEIFEAKLEETRKSHESAISEMKVEAEKKQKEIQDVVDEKENELAKLHENSQVLVDHVASLEAQMNTRSDTERFLATKIAKLEAKVKSQEAHIHERETLWALEASKAGIEAKKKIDLQEEKEKEFLNEKTKMNAIIEGLTADLDETKDNLASVESKLRDTMNGAALKQDEYEMKTIKSDAKFAKLEIDWANAQANVALLESQLKKRMQNEHLLASQVSNLASRLAESSNSTLSLSQELKGFEEQKATLQSTIDLLKKRLKNVTAVMESTREQQMSILDDAIAQEEMMAKCMESHAQMVSDTLQYEKEMQAVKDEMMETIERSFKEANEKRAERFKAVTSHGQSLSSMNGSRHSVLSCAQTVTSNVITALENDLNLETLQTEVNKLVIERKRIRENGYAAAAAPLNYEDMEIREESDKVPTESVEEVAQAEEIQCETIEVVSSPQKTLILTSTDSSPATEEEQRTEVEITPETDANVSRVTAE